MCTEIDDYNYQWKSSGDWRMCAEIWVCDNWIGNKVGSLTHAYKQKSNGNWVRKRAEITAEVVYEFYDNNCIFADDNDFPVSEIENQERVEVNKWKFFKKYKSIINYSITSKHKLEKGSTTIVLELKIKGEGC